MGQINYLSDFKIRESLLNKAPFRFSYYIKGIEHHKYVVSFDGVSYVNCRPEEDRLLIPIKAQFSPGQLMVDREYYLTDSDFSDGICHLQVNQHTNIDITTGESEISDIIVEVDPPYQQGIPGEAMTWEKMSSTDKSAFKLSVLEELKEDMMTSVKIKEVADIELYNL